MAENSNPPDLNLEQILATLASLPQTVTPPVLTAHQPQVPDGYGPQTETYSVSQSPPHVGSTYGQDQLLDPRQGPRPQAALYNREPIFERRTNTPVIDPATITEWKHGLRCVNKIAMQSPSFVSTIQKLIQDQARNVRDWESGRQRLIDEQAVKRENEKTHLAVLSLPGMGEKIEPLRTDEVEMEELEQYEKKVYRASQRLVESQSSALKSLGVPFFGLRPDLMRSEGGEDIGDRDRQEQRKITKKELLELQRKMLNHLVELYGD